jgi:hypothetical protein
VPEPGAPRARGLVHECLGLLFADGCRALAAFECERSAFAGFDVELGADAGGRRLEAERCGRGEGECPPRRSEDHSLGCLFDRRSQAAVVEARLEVESEVQAAAHAHDAADRPLALAAERHEVLDLGDPLRGEEAGDQDVCLRQVQLFRLQLGRALHVGEEKSDGPGRKITVHRDQSCARARSKSRR